MINNYSNQLLQLKDIIESYPLTVKLQTTVRDALALMNQCLIEKKNRYSYVLVVEESKLIGILTERDIVKLIAAEIDLNELDIASVMTTELITLKKSDFSDIYTVLKLLQTNRIRHLPIVDDLERLEGIVSVESICRALHPSNLLKFRYVEEAMTKEVLQAPKTANILNLSQLMASNRNSCVVIVEGKQSENNTELVNKSFSQLSIPIGIVTERDIVQFQTLNLDIVKTTAESVMSSPLVCMKITDSLMEVRQQMEKLRVRRLVVVGERGELQGIVNQSNMLKVLDPRELFEVIETLQSQLDERTKQLQKEKELAQVTLQSIGDAVITTDAVGKITNFNQIAEKLTGWKAELAVGKPLSEVFRIINESTREPIPSPVEKVLEENRVINLADCTLLIACNGTEYAIEYSAAPICNNLGEIIGIVIIFHDVTKSFNLTRQLSWQASHDALTGLYNRAKFEQIIVKAIAEAQNEGFRHTLCYLDLDRFKIVNDTCGHAAGDELLQQLTKLLAQKVRSTDILARLGGDEFGLLLCNCPLEPSIKIANHIREVIANFRFTFNSLTFLIGVSIGLVEIESTTEDLDSLMKAADAACYVAKQQGRNCARVYQKTDIEISKKDWGRQWIATLNSALDENSFYLYSQKIISLKQSRKTDSNPSADRVDRYEILLRLYDKDKKIVTPNVFIPAAERYHLMPAIDRWVITNFFTLYKEHCRSQNTGQLPKLNSSYSINLSDISINDRSFCVFVRKQFERFQISPNTICFDINETAAVSNSLNAAEFIQELKGLGCSIALDNFGSGRISLNYLKNLPVDYLKIDGSFIKNIVSDRVATATVKYFNEIAQIMNIKTVAKFVENQSILQKIREIGIDYGQGYAISRSMPLTFNLND